MVNVTALIDGQLELVEPDESVPVPLLVLESVPELFDPVPPVPVPPEFVELPEPFEPLELPGPLELPEPELPELPDPELPF